MALFGFGKSSEPTTSIEKAKSAGLKVAAGPDGLAPIEELLRVVISCGASDLHIVAGTAPCVRLHGSLIRLEHRDLVPEDTDALARAVLSDHNLRRLQEEGSVDFALDFNTAGRFRCSVYRQRGAISMALRLIPDRIRTLEEIGFPASVNELLHLPRGLILVTGPTGSGKTTTLASMINAINVGTDRHMITIEDPIEYYHPHLKGIVNQREVGVDVPTFAEGLRRALRQDPDVILVGEMRDLETMETAVTAAETGHLVFSTLHTTGAARTVDRIIDAFPAASRDMIRTQLSTNLKAVISQLLVPRADGKGRAAAFEIMINTSSIGALIRDSKTFRIPNDILTGSKYGMITLEQSLCKLHFAGLISKEEVLSKSQDPDLARQVLAEGK